MFSQHYRLFWPSNIHFVSWVYMRVGYVFEPRFSLGKISQFRLFLASLIKNRGTLRKFYLFLVGIIKTFEIWHNI